MNEQVGIAGYTEQMVYTSASGLEATHLHLRSWEELNDLALKAPSGARILQEIFDIAQTLLEKNISYGNSALEPARIFSQADPREQILVRIDDKLTRIKNSKEYPGDDTVLDLIGYLVLLRVS